MIPLNNNISFFQNKLVLFWFHPEDIYFRPILHFHDNSLISFSKVGDGFSFFSSLYENKIGISFHIKRERMVEFSRFGMYLSFGLERFIKIKGLISKLFSLFILYFSSISRKFPIFFFKRKKYVNLYDKGTKKTDLLFNNLYMKKKRRKLKLINKKEEIIRERIKKNNELKRSFLFGNIKGKIMYFFLKKKIHYFFKHVIFNQKKLIFYSLYKKYELFFFFYIKKIFYFFFIKKIFKLKDLFYKKNFYLFIFKRLFFKIKQIIDFFRNKYLKKFILSMIKKYLFSKYYSFLNMKLFNKIEFNYRKILNNSLFNNIFLLFNNYFFNFFKEKSISFFNNKFEKFDFFFNYKYKKEKDFYFSSERFQKGFDKYGFKFSRNRLYFSYIERRLNIFRSFFILFFNYFSKYREKELVVDLYETIYCDISPFSFSIEDIYTSDVKRQLLNYCVEISSKAHSFFNPLLPFYNIKSKYKYNNKFLYLDSIIKKKYEHNESLLRDSFIRPLGVPEYIARLRYSKNKKYKNIYYKYLFKYIGKEKIPAYKMLSKQRDNWFFLNKKPYLFNRFSKNYVGSKNFFDIGFNLAIQLNKYPEKWIHNKFIFKKHLNKGKRKERYKTIPSSFFVENVVHNYIIPFNIAIKNKFFLTTRELFKFFNKIKYKFLFPLSNFILFFFCFNNRLDCFIHRLFPFYHIRNIRTYIKNGIVNINGKMISDFSFLINQFDFISFSFNWSLKKKDTSLFYFGQQYFLLLFYVIFTLGRHLLRYFLKKSFFKLIFKVFGIYFIFFNNNIIDYFKFFKYITFNNLIFFNNNLKINRFFDSSIIFKFNIKKKEKEYYNISKKIISPILGISNIYNKIDNLFYYFSFERFFLLFYYSFLKSSLLKKINKYFFIYNNIFFPFLNNNMFNFSFFVIKKKKKNFIFNLENKFFLKKKKKNLFVILNFFFKKNLDKNFFFIKKINFFIRFFTVFMPNFFLNEFFYFSLKSNFFFLFCNSSFFFDFIIYFFNRKYLKKRKNKKINEIDVFLEKKLIFLSFYFLFYKLYFFFKNKKNIQEYKLFIKKKLKILKNIYIFIPHLKNFFYILYWYCSLIEDLSFFSFNLNISINNKFIFNTSFLLKKNIDLCYKVFFSFFERIINNIYFFSYELERLVSSYFLLSWESIYSFSFKSYNFDMFFFSIQSYLPTIEFKYVSNLKNFIIIKNYNQLPSYIKFKRINGIPRTLYGKLEFFKRIIYNNMTSKFMKSSHLYSYRSRNVTPHLFEYTTYGKPYYYGNPY